MQCEIEDNLEHKNDKTIRKKKRMKRSLIGMFVCFFLFDLIFFLFNLIIKERERKRYNDKEKVEG